MLVLILRATTKGVTKNVYILKETIRHMNQYTRKYKKKKHTKEDSN